MKDYYVKIKSYSEGRQVVDFLKQKGFSFGDPEFEKHCFQYDYICANVATKTIGTSINNPTNFGYEEKFLFIGQIVDKDYFTRPQTAAKDGPYWEVYPKPPKINLPEQYDKPAKAVDWEDCRDYLAEQSLSAMKARLVEIAEAIVRYAQAGKKVDSQWIAELSYLNELIGKKMKAQQIQQTLKIMADVITGLHQETAKLKAERKRFNAMGDDVKSGSAGDVEYSAEDCYGQAALYSPYVKKYSKKLASLAAIQKSLKHELKCMQCLDLWAQQDEADWIAQAELARQENFVEPYDQSEAIAGTLGVV